MQSYSELRVWQKSHELVLEVYRLSADFPAHERFGLTSQLRRAAMLSKDLGYLAKTEELEDRIGKIAAMLRTLRLRVAA